MTSPPPETPPDPAPDEETAGGPPNAAASTSTSASPSVGASPTQGQGVPMVVAVVATRDPDERFDDVLESLATQDYPGLVVLVVDAGSSSDLRTRVAEVAPSAFVRRVEADVSFATAMNQVLESVEGATFFLFLHDDAALAPGAVQGLVSEAFRANAGIAGAKLVDWDRPDRIRSVGARIDRFAYPAPISEPDELDQGQHDVPQEVFMVSGAAMLVRADLFRDLAGFDPAVDLVAAELDLCWRARVAGARTVIAPAAVARHATASRLADPDATETRRATRAQARALLTCASVGTLVRVLPVAIVFSTLDLLLNLVTGRFRQAGDIVGAWAWNLAHLPRTLGARRRTQRQRRSSDREIAAQQVGGSARLSAYFRRARSMGEVRLPAAIASARGLPSQWQEGSGGLALGGLALVALVLLVGSRGLVTGGVAAMRELAPLDDPRGLMASWWAGWRPTGFGHAAPAPLLHVVLGLADLVTFGSTGFVRTTLVLGPLFLGPLGAWRMLRGLGSVRARLAATVAYATTPVGVDAVATGRLQALALYGAMPWIIGGLLRVAGSSPLDGGTTRNPVRAGVGLGLVTAAAMLVAPVAVVALLATGVVVAAVEAVGGTQGARRVVTATAAATLSALVVHLPSVVDVLSERDRWGSIWMGGSWTTVPSLRRLVGLSTGPTPGGWLFVGLAVSAALVLVVGKGWRLRCGAAGWLLAGGAWLLIAALARWSLESHLPPISMLFVPAAAGLALAVGAGAAAFESDVMGSVFGIRQVISIVALVALALSSLPILVAAGDGRWRSPNLDVSVALASLDDGAGQHRTLWLGSPDDLPGAAEVVEDGLAVLITTGTIPTFDDVIGAPLGAAERRLVEHVRLLLSGETRSIGSRLAGLAIDHVVVLRSADGRGDTTSEVLEPVLDVLDEQLDLRSVDVSPGIEVYRVDLARPIRSATTSDGGEPEAVLDADGPTAARGELPDGARVEILQGGEWRLEVGGRSIEASPVDGWAQGFDVPDGGRARLTVATSGGHRVLVLVQLAAIVLLAAAAARTRRAEPHQLTEAVAEEEVPV